MIYLSDTQVWALESFLYNDLLKQNMISAGLDYPEDTLHLLAQLQLLLTLSQSN